MLLPAPHTLPGLTSRKRALFASVDGYQTDTESNKDDDASDNKDEAADKESSSSLAKVVGVITDADNTKDTQSSKDAKKADNASKEINLFNIGPTNIKRRLPSAMAALKDRHYDRKDPDRPLETQDELGIAKRWLVAQERAVDGMLQAQEDWVKVGVPY